MSVAKKKRGRAGNSRGVKPAGVSKRAGKQQLCVCQPLASAEYGIEEIASMVAMPKRMILVYWKNQLIEPVSASEADTPLKFSGATVIALQLMEALRTREGVNIPGIKWVLRLNQEIARLGALLTEAR